MSSGYQIRRILSTRISKPCVCEQAQRDFILWCHGALPPLGQLRLGRHAAKCEECRALLATLVVMVGLQRTLRAGLGGVLPGAPAPWLSA
jgi:hypothetical protein